MPAARSRFRCLPKTHCSRSSPPDVRRHSRRPHNTTSTIQSGPRRISSRRTGRAGHTADPQVEGTMRGFRFAAASIVFAALMASVEPLYAQDAAAAQALRAEIDQVKKDFDARLADLESRLAALGGTPPAPPVVAEPVTPIQTPTPPPTAQTTPATPPDAALPAYNPTASKVFNPDMAVIGNLLGATGKNEVNPLPALQLSESEVSLQAIVDPYARADFFLSFGEEGVAVEEGYVTFPTLPGGLLVKVGKMRA